MGLFVEIRPEGFLLQIVELLDRKTLRVCNFGFDMLTFKR
jgi:hypothetical protein